MKRYILLFVFILFSKLSSAQSQTTFKRLDAGIELQIQQPVSVILRIEAVNENSFHVQAFPPDSDVSKTENLMISPYLKAYTGSWNLDENAKEIQIKIPACTAIVSKENGTVKFLDKNGNELLSEKTRTENSFIPDSYDGDSFYKVKQAFIVSADEGLYGLGQHQNGVMNYNNGRQVTLLQYNTTIGIPFLYSTKNYGILWNNYSITKAGDTRDFLPLNGLKLISQEGQQGWITANYYDKSNPEKLVFSRPESEISYLYLSDQSKFPEGIKLENSIIKYEGKIESPYAGLHRFHFNYSGYLKVWINGVLKEDRWRESWNAGSFDLAEEMKPWQQIDFKMEWIPDGGQAYLGLKVQTPIPTNLQNVFSFDSEAGVGVDYYFMAGDNGDEVIKSYREITGKAPILPKWAFGFWQSRERYKTQAELEEVAAEFRERQIPIDNIVQDWSYWKENDWGSHDFDKNRFPDPKGMVDFLHKNHFRIMISVWPKVNEESSVYQDFKNKGWLYMRNIYDGRKDWIGKGYTSTFYDPFNAEARQGFWNMLDKKLYKIGIDAWWMDASEPDVHSNINLDERKSVMQPKIGSSVRYYNAFPLENARGIYEGQLKTDPDNRVFILTRSFFAGQQRYAAVAWSGDISSRWHDMKDQISAGVNFSMSGTPYWTMDAGGFLVEKRYHQATGQDLEDWRELNSRWYQYGAFLPLFRAHGQFPFREPFNIADEGHPAYSSMLYYIKLRYKMLPYLYSLAGNVYHGDGSLIKAVAMQFPEDKNTYNLNDQFLLGNSVLVSPVTVKGAASRQLYLPAGTIWYDFYSGKIENGGKQINAAAPYEKIPVFVKAGTILALGPDLQYTDEKKAEEITLFVYAGVDASFKLYEDEGTNNNYESGKSSSIDFTYKDTNRTLEISDVNGAFNEMLDKRTFKVVLISDKNPQGYDSTKLKSKTVKYSGKKVKLNLI